MNINSPFDFLYYMIVLTYDYLTQEIIITNCECYQEYKDFDKLIEEKKNYFACISYNGIIVHKIFPIMIGSSLDRS